MKNLFVFFFFILFCAQTYAQTVSHVRNQSVNPTYKPDGTTAKPPLCFNRSNHTFWGYAGNTWYQISATAATAPWLLQGNAGTDGGTTDFLGTTDAQDLVLKTNNQLSATFGLDGNVTLCNNAFVTNAATGQNSLAWGSNCTASAPQSTAWGQDCTASEGAATAFGTSCFANGAAATAWGIENIAPSYSETVLGHYSVPYTANNPLYINSLDRLYTIGNGTIPSGQTVPNNALTIWKDGRGVMNTNATNTDPIKNTWFGIQGTFNENYNHIRTRNALAAFSTEHTPSGNFAVFGSTAANSGIAIPSSRQFAFTTTTGGSVSAGITTTIGNYSDNGFLFGGGSVATSTIDVAGSIAVNTLNINASIILTNAHTAIVCNNGGTDIAITLPTASTCRGRIYMISRGEGSTGIVNITPIISSIQDLAGTLGATTTLSALGSYGQHVILQSNGTEWYRKN